MRTEKPWGYEEILEENEFYVLKFLYMQGGHQCSWQYHERKVETVFVLEGRLTLVLEGEERVLWPRECVTILPGVRHRMCARDGVVAYLETSTPHLDDVVRLGDDYGRDLAV